MDGHRHVHQLPGVRELLLAVLAERWRHARPWVRRTRPAAGAGLKPHVIAATGDRGLAALCAQQGRRTNAHLLGSYGFDADAAGYLARLDVWLREARDGDLLMCHPATRAPADDPIASARVVEAQVLAGAAFGALLARSHVAVVRLSQCLG